MTESQRSSGAAIRSAGLLGLFDQLGQPGLVASSLVGVDQVVRAGSIEFLCSGAQFFFCLLDVTSSYGLTDFLDLCTNSTSFRLVLLSSSLVLPQSFFGTLGVWHLEMNLSG